MKETLYCFIAEYFIGELISDLDTGEREFHWVDLSSYPQNIQDFKKYRWFQFESTESINDFFATRIMDREHRTDAQLLLSICGCNVWDDDYTIIKCLHCVSPNDQFWASVDRNDNYWEKRVSYEQLYREKYGKENSR